MLGSLTGFGGLEPFCVGVAMIDFSETKRRRLVAKHTATLEQIINQILDDLSHPEVMWMLAHLLRKYSSEFLSDEWKLEYLTALMSEENQVPPPQATENENESNTN